MYPVLFLQFAGRDRDECDWLPGGHQHQLGGEEDDRPKPTA
jgi:hypothetical protein